MLISALASFVGGFCLCCCCCCVKVSWYGRVEREGWKKKKEKKWERNFWGEIWVVPVDCFFDKTRSIRFWWWLGEHIKQITRHHLTVCSGIFLLLYLSFTLNAREKKKREIVNGLHLDEQSLKKDKNKKTIWRWRTKTWLLLGPATNH